MFTGILMASGYSRRMGRNKLLLPFRGKPLFRHGLEAACASRLDHCIVITNQPEIMGFCQSSGIRYIENNLASEGQSASIRLGAAHAPAGSSYMFLPADQPFLSPDIINRLISAGKESPGSIIIPKYNGISGSPAVFPHALKAELCALSGGARGSKVIREHSGLLRFIHFEEDLPLADIDTPEDYARYSE